MENKKQGLSHNNRPKGQIRKPWIVLGGIAVIGIPSILIVAASSTGWFHSHNYDSIKNQPQYTYTNGVLTIDGIEIPEDESEINNYYESLRYTWTDFPYTDADELKITIDNDGHGIEYDEISILTDELVHDDGFTNFKSLHDFFYQEPWYRVDYISSRARPIQVVLDAVITKANQ